MGGCDLSVEKHPVMIIGAGIGGLTTAAYLSKLGVPSLLLEKTSSIGGRCSTRMINGQKYEIGAIYVGGGVFDHLRRTFGASFQSIPFRCGIKMNNRIVPFPFNWKTIWELKRCGITWLDLFRFKLQSRIFSQSDTFDRYKSVGELFDAMITNQKIRRYFDVLVGVSGLSPYRLSSDCFRPGNPTEQYKAFNPEYLNGGNGQIASILRDIAGKNCQISFNTKAIKIIIKNGNVSGVQTDKGEVQANIVVSNTGIRSTVFKLTEPGNWPRQYYKNVQQLPETLQVTNIFLTFKRSFKIPKGFSVFFVSYDINKEFQTLATGCFPEDSMFIFHVPSNIEPHSIGDHRATLQFYHPKRNIDAKLADEQAKRIMSMGLNNLFSGLSKAITGYSVYYPEKYKEEFGFPPNVYGVAPDVGVHRFPIQTPVKSLFLVGDSVAPEGPCVPQAMESGLDCARVIAAKFGVDLPTE